MQLSRTSQVRHKAVRTNLFQKLMIPRVPRVVCTFHVAEPKAAPENRLGRSSPFGKGPCSVQSLFPCDKTSSRAALASSQCPAQSRGLFCPSGARAHLNQTGAWPASGRLTCDAGHYCRERVCAVGGARDSKASFVLQRSLSPWRRMRAPQVQTRGSTSKIFLSRRDQVPPASLEKSELSFSACVSAAQPVLPPTTDEVVALARLL